MIQTGAVGDIWTVLLGSRYFRPSRRSSNSVSNLQRSTRVGSTTPAIGIRIPKSFRETRYGVWQTNSTKTVFKLQSGGNHCFSMLVNGPGIQGAFLKSFKNIPTG